MRGCQTEDANARPKSVGDMDLRRLLALIGSHKLRLYKIRSSVC